MMDKTLLRDWQTKWYLLLGEDPTYMSDPTDDHTLSIVWGQDNAVVRRALELLPMNEIVISRVMEVLNCRSSLPATDEELLNLGRTMLRRLEVVLNHPVADPRSLQLIHTTWNQRGYFVDDEEYLTVQLDDILFDLIGAEYGNQFETAAVFLKEPLYQMTSFYEPAHWVLWGFMADSNLPDPYEPCWLLFQRNTQAWLTNKGVILTKCE